MREDKDSIIAALEMANKEKDSIITHVIEKSSRKERELLNEIRYLQSVILKERK